MKIVIISPTYFDGTSVIGGGERYPLELGYALSKCADVTLVSFSNKRLSLKRDNLKIEIYKTIRLLGGNKGNPLSFVFIKELWDADVIHTQQTFAMVSDLACLFAVSFGIPVFTTNHGGGGHIVLNGKLPILQNYTGVFAYSQFMARILDRRLGANKILVRGGIDLNVFKPAPEVLKLPHVLFVGRILPHKGIDYLVSAFRLWGRDGWRLRIVGRPYGPEYLTKLRAMAEGLNVDFLLDASDTDLLKEYQSARVTVLPSVHMDCYGKYSYIPELMGLTLLESQACGTPAICTDAGAMPEFVSHKNTGYIARQNSPESLVEALDYVANETTWPKLAQAARPFCEIFSWESLAQLHLAAYRKNRNCI